MLRYLLKRLVGAVLVVFVVSSFVFLLNHLSGDPVALMLPPGADQNQIEVMRQTMGLDKPLHVQFVSFVTRLAKGDFGESIRHREPALQLVAERLPASLALVSAALLVTVLISVPLGIVSALRRDSVYDMLSTTLAVFGQSIPAFWLGMMLILVFAVKLKWLPTGGGQTLVHLILPSITLGLFSAGALARLLRSSMLEVMSSDYVRTARAKGMPERIVVYRHALKNAAIPVLTMLGTQLPTLLGGAIITEQVFSFPGMARLAVQSVGYRDGPVVQAFVVLITLVVVITNLVVDLLYTVLDPRVRLDGRRGG